MGDGEFVIITAPGQDTALIAEATARFVEAILSRFYPAAAYQQGYMMAPGQLHRCLLAALSFDVVDLLVTGAVNVAGVPLFERLYRR